METNLLEVFRENRSIADILENPTILFVCALVAKFGQTTFEGLQEDIGLDVDELSGIIQDLEYANLLTISTNQISVTDHGHDVLNDILLLPSSNPVYERLKLIYGFASQYLFDKGRPPTMKEISQGVKISPAIVNHNLAILDGLGLIQRERQVVRGLRLLGENVRRTTSSMQIPLLGTIAAGAPIPLPVDGVEPLDMLTLSSDLIYEQNDLFALRVKGNSMIDALIADGDIVVMKSHALARDGAIVAVWLRENNETTLKRIYRDQHNRIRLQPMNPTMKAFWVDARNVEIQGEVVMVIRQFDRLV